MKKAAPTYNIHTLLLEHVEKAKIIPLPIKLLSHYVNSEGLLCTKYLTYYLFNIYSYKENSVDVLIDTEINHAA